MTNEINKLTNLGVPPINNIELPKISPSLNSLLANALAKGQTLEARVLQVDAKAQTLTLEINGQPLKVKGELPLKAGDTLTVVLRQQGDKLILSLKPTAPPATDASIKQAVQDKLVSHFNEQQPLSALKHTINQITAQSSALTNPKIQQAVSQFIDNLPKPQDIQTADNVKTLIRQSGLFMENNLGTLSDKLTQAVVQYDLKAMLAKLKQNLEQARPQPTTKASLEQLPTKATPPPPSPSGPPKPDTLLTKQVGSEANISQSKIDRNTLLSEAKAVEAQPAESKPSTTKASPTPLSQATTASKPLPQTTAQDTKTNPEQQSTFVQLTRTAPTTSSEANMLIKRELTKPSHHLPNQQTALAHTTQNAFTEESLEILLRAVSGNLARLALTQVATLSAEQPTVNLTNLEIPLHHEENIDNLLLTIQEEEPNGSSDANKRERIWRVQLAFDLDCLGPLQVTVMLQGKRLATTFWTEESKIQHLVNTELKQLRQELVAEGIEVDELCCQKGTPPKPKPLSPLNLVDTKV